MLYELQIIKSAGQKYAHASSVVVSFGRNQSPENEYFHLLTFQDNFQYKITLVHHQTGSPNMNLEFFCKNKNYVQHF